MEIKVGTKSLNSYFIIFVFVLMEHCFYLINTDTFRIIFLNYAMTWFLLFMAGIVLLYIRYRLNRKSVRMYFSSDVSALIVLAIISIVQCNFLIGQPLSMGFAPQRNYIFILVSYFTIRKLIALDKIDINTVVNGLLFCGVLSVIIYWLQVNLIDYVQFVHVYKAARVTRLYVDSFMCVIIGFLGLSKYLEENNKKYLSFVAIELVYELIIGQSRLELASVVLGYAVMILLMKRLSFRKICMILIGVIAVVVFINSAFFERFNEALQMQFYNTTTGIDTMAIRKVARDEFVRQLKQSPATLIFGCGYPNIGYSGTASTAYIAVGNERIGLVDNGIFAFVYVYGLLGASVVIKWFYKLYKSAWKLYKIKNIYWPLGFVISLTILLYNITFWWNKPSWTLGMVFLMCYMEHKLNDELDEEK